MSMRRDKDLFILGVIPARSGSKGIPDKNTRPFAGRSLLEIAVKEASGSHLLTDTIVSTDSKTIAKHVLSCGGKAPSLRPKELAADDVPVWKVIEYVLDYYNDKKESPDIIVTLQPTSPFRTSSHIDRAIELFVSSDADALLSLSEAVHTPYKMRIVKDGMVDLFIKDTKVLQRQEAPLVYQLNGIVYISKKEVIRTKKSLWSKGRTIPYILPAGIGVNIDTAEEFEYAEWLYERREKKS